MSLDKNLFPFGQHAEEQQIKTDPIYDTAPDPSDVLGTMKWWDEYRAKKRAEIAGMQISWDENGNVDPTSEVGRDFRSMIGEFPTELTLAAKADEELRRLARSVAQEVLPPVKETLLSKVRRWFRCVFAR